MPHQARAKQSLAGLQVLGDVLSDPDPRIRSHVIELLSTLSVLPVVGPSIVTKGPLGRLEALLPRKAGELTLSDVTAIRTVRTLEGPRFVLCRPLRGHQSPLHFLFAPASDLDSFCLTKEHSLVPSFRVQWFSL